VVLGQGAQKVRSHAQHVELAVLREITRCQQGGPDRSIYAAIDIPLFIAARDQAKELADPCNGDERAVRH